MHVKYGEVTVIMEDHEIVEAITNYVTNYNGNSEFEDVEFEIANVSRNPVTGRTDFLLNEI